MLDIEANVNENPPKLKRHEVEAEAARRLGADAEDEKLAQNPDYRQILGDVLSEHGRLTEAIGEYRKALALDSQNPRRYTCLADAYSAADLPTKALGLYEKALKLNGGDPEAFVGLGDMAVQHARSQVAAKEYRRAVAREPKRTFYRYKLAIALSATGAVNEAIEQMTAAVELSPDDAFYRFALGDLCCRFGRSDEGVAALEKAVALAPLDDYYHLRLGAAYLKSGNPGRALPLFARSVELRPRNRSYRLLYGMVLRRAGMVERSKEETLAAGCLDAYERDFVLRIAALSGEATVAAVPKVL